MVHLLQSLFKKNKIRSKILIFFLVMISLMSFTSIYTYFSSQGLLQEWDKMFYSNVYLNEIHYQLSQSEKYLERYLTTKHSESFSQFMKYSTNLKQEVKKIKDVNSRDEKQLLLKDIRNMVHTYLYEAEAAINARRGRNINKYTTHYMEATKVAEYINFYIDRLNMKGLQENTEKYISIQDRINFVQLITMVLIILMIVSCIILIIWFSYRITQPIVELSTAANQVSAGNYNIDKIELNTDDEMSLLARAFNRMVRKVKEDIEEIKEKARLQEQLKEKEVQNLTITNLLKETELFALQSQINPHFIFNTLNAGMQLAMFEGADKTVNFMENMASYMRYNMKNLNKDVTLEDELKNIKNYINILKTRYKDKIKFDFIIEEEILDAKIPSMVLQPIVENAFIHGISQKENGGTISIEARKKDNEIRIIVEDDGQGFNKETRDYILSLNTQPEIHLEKEQLIGKPGIGLGNIIYRLKLFFGRDRIIDIKSKAGEFTKIILELPYIPDREE